MVSRCQHRGKREAKRKQVCMFWGMEVNGDFSVSILMYKVSSHEADVASR